ncbi:MAG: SDR family oxidoreductase [Woeseiaceae bacterium]
MIFNNKTVIVTGGSEGVGAAVARKFAEAGANLMLVARSKKNLEAVAEELRDLTHVEIFAMDVTDADACVDVFKKSQFEFGRVDILVNNAGCQYHGLVRDVKADDLGRIIDVNLKAPIMLSRIALPYLEENGGVIVNVASLAGKTAVPGSSAYSCSKFALRIFSRALADELRGSDIKIATVSPGPVDTGFILTNIDEVSDITFSQPMSTAEDVAQTILDLCGNNVHEQSMPAFSGFLATLSYLFPWLGRWMKPSLERKGANAKREWKRKMQAQKEA